MHQVIIEEDGETVDVIELCSDSCAQDYCEREGIEYDGWSGCHETEFTQWCQNCGVVLIGTDGSECEHQRMNVVVNRFLSIEGEKCECGNWIQVPKGFLGWT